MSGFGVPQYAIAEMIGISIPTLEKHYRSELDSGAGKANMKVAQSLFQMATNIEKPNVVAAIFWLKSRAGWRDHDNEGKKEKIAAAAKDVASGAFSPMAPPKLISVGGSTV
jgi:hypothetical protein